MPMFIVRGLAAALVSSAVFLAFPLADATAQRRLAAVESAPDALAVTARGAWSPTVNYVTDDLVTLRNSAWRAKRANRGKLPGQTLPSTAADWSFSPEGLIHLDRGRRREPSSATI